MTRFYLWVATGALSFVAAMTLIKPTEHVWASLYILTICLATGALVTAVKRFEPNPWLAYLLMLLVFGIGAAAVARQIGATP
jgi:hypothetical protein